MGIEPTPSAWKAEVLPLNYTRLVLHHPFTINFTLIGLLHFYFYLFLVEGVGFEPTKAEPTDLQSALVDRLSTPPKFSRLFSDNHPPLSTDDPDLNQLKRTILPVKPSLISLGFIRFVIFAGIT